MIILKFLLVLGLLLAVAYGGTIDGIRYGLTFGKSLHLARYNIDAIGCQEYSGARVNPEISYNSFVNYRMDNPFSIASIFKRCNPATGDTLCNKRLPILCVKKQFPRPVPLVPSRDYALDYEFSKYWIDANLATTAPVNGTDLRNIAYMNSLCEYHHGSLWRAANFNETVSGFAFYGYGNIRTDLNYWVYVINQRGNCWDV